MSPLSKIDFCKRVWFISFIKTITRLLFLKNCWESDCCKYGAFSSAAAKVSFLFASSVPLLLFSSPLLFFLFLFIFSSSFRCCYMTALCRLGYSFLSSSFIFSSVQLAAFISILCSLFFSVLQFFSLFSNFFPCSFQYVDSLLQFFSVLLYFFISFDCPFHWSVHSFVCAIVLCSKFCFNDIQP